MILFFVSLDVTSLFTNIPYHLVLNCLGLRQNVTDSKCKIPFLDVFDMVKFIFSNTYFQFNSVIYQQLSTSMTKSTKQLSITIK